MTERLVHHLLLGIAIFGVVTYSLAIVLTLAQVVALAVGLWP